MEVSDQRKKGALPAMAGAILFLLLFALFGALAFLLSGRLEQELPASADIRPLVIIDPGHGGEDGGAVGVNGVLEKDLNLAYAEALAELLRLSGVDVILTREEDLLLSDGLGGTRKEQDLRARLALAGAHPEAIFVSLHMNTFGSRACHGLQVYYTDKVEGSEQLGLLIQDKVAKMADESNRRRVQRATSAIYLLHRAETTSVLVECGFLSHPEECENLCREEYKRKLCFAIYCGIMEYINKGGNET